MEWSRRSMLSASIAGILGLPARSSSFDRRGAPLRILFLGGTGFLGPHMVRQAMERGHRVTLFTRGRHGTELFPDVERLVGDRKDNLTALSGRTWDAVIDNSGYIPAHVAASADLLAKSVGHYFYTSTGDAYRDFHQTGITEDYPLATLPAGTPHDPQRYYGPLKALCEAEVRRVFPDRHTIVRPGWVAGPGDNNHLFTYWVMRMVRGGDVLAPGTPDDPTQLIDVRDLAAFTVDTVERRTVGAFNAVGPTMTFAEMLKGIMSVTGGTSTLTWVDADFLGKQGVTPYIDLPLWWPPRNDYQATIDRGGMGGGVGAFTISGAKARAAGLRNRPLVEVARDTLKWYQSAYTGWNDGPRPGLTAEREAAILAAWRRR